MNIFISKAASCTDPNRHTRFMSETESFLIGFTGLSGFVVEKPIDI
jgi:hypothetical protein